MKRKSQQSEQSPHEKAARAFVAQVRRDAIRESISLEIAAREAFERATRRPA